RVTPNLYTTLDEVDTFAAAMERLKPGDAPARTAGSPPFCHAGVVALRPKTAYGLLPASVNAQFTVRRISMRRTFLYGLMTALLVAGATTAPRAQGGKQTLVAILSGGSEAPGVVNTGAYGKA